MELPPGADRPAEYFPSDLLAAARLKRLVTAAKDQWWVEHSYRELKGELGLDRFEGRSWRGWHHRVVLALMAYASLQDVRRRRRKKRRRADPPLVRERLQSLLACWCARRPVRGPTVFELAKVKPP